MKYFLCKLIPPRPNFPQEMTDAERKIMEEHVVYWKGLVDNGIAVVFGPVADPAGNWGVAIVDVETEADLRALEANDPTITSGLNFKYEIYPMPRAIFRT